MSNVIQLNVRPRNPGANARQTTLIETFSWHRRNGDDVFWLKENAELLNILECTGAKLGEASLEPMHQFYNELEQRLGFFPQYYRFLLSICLDLEDLGLSGAKGESLAAWVAHQGLADAELSDLQRAEACRLLGRRGVDPYPEDKSLETRLHAFIDRSETFAMPNKKAAYELTHILFYLSEYGRRDPKVSRAAVISLEYAGLLAYLEQNADLLAEVCVAMRYAGATPSPVWEDWLDRETRAFSVESGFASGSQDNYHDYFVCNWAMSVAGRPAFSRTYEPGASSYFRPQPWPGPLRNISECMFRLGDTRSDDWHAMRPHVEAELSDIGHDILAEAEASTDRFDDFFAGFARTGLRGVAL